MPDSTETVPEAPAETVTNAAVTTPTAPEHTVIPNGAEPAAVPLAPSPRRRSSVRGLLLAPLALIAIAVGGYFGYNFWRDSQLFVSTDDALVDANLVSIAAPASGTLANWRVRPGDSVRAGQVIGTVRTAPAGVNLPTINIVAPQDGTILKVDGKEGQVIGTAQAIAYLANLSSLTVTAYVNETDVHRLRLGQEVDITADGTGSEQFQGTVSEIIPATASEFALIQTQDRGSGNFTKVSQRIEVHIDLGDTGGTALYPGMNAKVRIHVA